jgi:superfamily I DNA and/or RNA helicase
VTQDKKVLHFITDFFVELEKFEFSDDHPMIDYLRKDFLKEYNFFNIGTSSRKYAYKNLYEIARLKDIIFNFFNLKTSNNWKNIDKINEEIKQKMKSKSTLNTIKKIPVLKNNELFTDNHIIINTPDQDLTPVSKVDISNESKSKIQEIGDNEIKYNFTDFTGLLKYLLSVEQQTEINEFFNIFLKNLISNANKPKTFHKIGNIFRLIKTSENSKYEKSINSFLNFMMTFFLKLDELIPEYKDSQLMLYLNDNFLHDFKEFQIGEGIKKNSSKLVPKFKNSNLKDIFIKFYRLTNFEEKQKKKYYIALADYLINKYLSYENDIFIILGFYQLEEYEAISYVISKFIRNKLFEEAYFILKVYDFNDKIFINSRVEDELKDYLKETYCQDEVFLNNQETKKQIDVVEMRTDLNEDQEEKLLENYDENLEIDKYEDYDQDEYNYDQNYQDNYYDEDEKILVYSKNPNEFIPRDLTFYKKLESRHELIFHHKDELKPMTINTFEIGINQKINFIENIEELKNLKNELIDKELGIDMEWKPDLIPSDFNKGSILQISGKNEIYIFDLLSLDSNPEFYSIFIEKFENKTFIAYDFSDDYLKMNSKLSEFFKQKDRLIDLSIMYKNMYPKKKKPGLAKLCLFLLEKTICKFYQCSNWTKRPLTNRQLHYAAMDAYILLELYEALNELKKKEVRIRDHKDFELINKKENLDLYQKLPSYSTRLIELLEFEKRHEEKASIESVKNQTIGDLRDNKIILEDLIFYDVKKDKYLSGYVLTFQKLEKYTEIDKGDIIGVYTYQNKNSEMEENIESEIEVVQEYQIDYNEHQQEQSKSDEEFLNDTPIYKAEVLKVSNRFISVLCDSEMVDLPENPDFCFVQLTNFNAYRSIKNSLRYMQKCEILNYSVDVFKVLLNIKDPIIHNPEDTTEDEKFKLKSLFNKKINFSQIASIENCLRSKELSLIHGPPGTGKTSTLTEYILQSVQRNKKILVCAYNNIAVDNIAEMLIVNKLNNPWLKFEICRMGRPSKVLESVMETCMEAYVNKSPYSEHQDIIYQLISSMKNLDEASKTAVKSKIFKLQQEIDFYKKIVIDRSDVVLCTNVGAGNKILFDYVEQYENFFDLVIIDEAAQAPEYSCWVPILLGKKLVMAGDHKQLPPTIKSEEAKVELSYTLFEKMDDAYGQNRKKEIYKNSITSMLQVQYRSNRLIMEFSSQEFYNGELIAHESVQNRSLMDLVKPKKDFLNIMTSSLIQIDTSKLNYRESENMRKSFVNEGEAEIVEFLVGYLLTNGIQGHEIGVITPYRGQVRLIKSKLDFKARGIAVASVDGFQGREKEVIILSLVRSNMNCNIGFVKNDRRINVALTRAKRLIILIWDSRNYEKFPLFKRLDTYLMKNAYYLNAGELIYKNSNSSLGSSNNYVNKKNNYYNQNKNNQNRIVSSSFTETYNNQSFANSYNQNFTKNKNEDQILKTVNKNSNKKNNPKKLAQPSKNNSKTKLTPDNKNQDQLSSNNFVITYKKGKNNKKQK